MATKQVAFRLEQSLLKRVDAYAKRMTEATPGVEFSRAAAVRFLLTYALEDLEGRSNKKSRKR